MAEGGWTKSFGRRCWSLLPIVVLLGALPGMMEACAWKSNQHRLEEADQYVVIADDSGTDAALYNNRGVLKMLDGDMRGAVNDFREAIKRNPNEAGYYENLAAAQEAAGDHAGALKTRESSRRINPR
jgi:Flp pilus assembly protein TadD